MQRIALLSLGLLLTAFVFNSACATQILIVTDNGNVFPIANTSSSSATGTGNGNGNGTGNGVVAQIVTTNPKGLVIAGIDSATGNSSSLRPYNKVNTGTFAAGFQTTDSVQKMYIPQINAPYAYSNGVLQSSSTQLPNILSPSTTTILSGSPSSTTSSSGIGISGPGTLGILLNSGLGSTVVTGSGITGGGSAFFGTLIDPTMPPIAYDGGTHGYTVLSSSSGETVSGGYTVTIPVNKYVSSINNAYAQYNWYYSNRVYCGYQVSCGGNQYYYPIDTGPATATINGYQSGNYYYVTSLSYTTTDTYAANYFPYRSYPYYTGSNYYPYFTLFDKSPFDSSTKTPTYTSDFQSQVNFNPSYQYWLIVKPTSGGTTISATNYDPSTQMFLQATNLPSNVPFQILQNGVVGVQGVTSSSGTISLSASQIAAGGQSSISGELDIYPNSPAYIGTIGTAVYDTVNNQMFNMPAASQQIYTSFAYVQIPMAAKTNIQNVVANTTSLISIPYLSNTYNAGSSMMVPIIPGLKSISFSLNGIQTVLKMSSITSNLGISIVTSGTNSNSGYDTNGVPLQISADTGGEASAIAPKDGTMYALVNAQVSADTAYTTGATYNYQQTATQYIYEVYNPSIGWYVKAPCPQDQFQASGCTDHLSYASSSAHAGPLDVYVDIYVNGVFSGSQIIYYNPNPIIQQTSSVNSWSFSGSNAMAMHYPTSQASGIVQIPVHAGDLVEFYMRAHVDAYGDPVSVPTGYYGIFITTNQVCTASATINLNSGSILTGIS